jgi:phage-related protein
MAKIQLIKRTESGTLKKAIIHPLARETLSQMSGEIKDKIGHLIFELQKGENLGMPDSRPMKSISQGCYELRVKSEDGIYRAFYFLKNVKGILVFHIFVKKNQKTRQEDIELGRKRLLEMLELYD